MAVVKNSTMRGTCRFLLRRWQSVGFFPTDVHAQQNNKNHYCSASVMSVSSDSTHLTNFPPPYIPIQYCTVLSHTSSAVPRGSVRENEKIPTRTASRTVFKSLASNLSCVRRVADSTNLSPLGILVFDPPYSWLVLPLGQVAMHPPCRPAALQRTLLAARLPHYVRTTLTVRVRARSLDTRVPSDT